MVAPGAAWVPTKALRVSLSAASIVWARTAPVALSRAPATMVLPRSGFWRASRRFLPCMFLNFPPM